jgi:hypothetical protein
MLIENLVKILLHQKVSMNTKKLQVHPVKYQLECCTLAGFGKRARKKRGRQDPGGNVPGFEKKQGHTTLPSASSI